MHLSLVRWAVPLRLCLVVKRDRQMEKKGVDNQFVLGPVVMAGYCGLCLIIWWTCVEGEVGERHGCRLHSLPWNKLCSVVLFRWLPAFLLAFLVWQVGIGRKDDDHVGSWYRYWHDRWCRCTCNGPTTQDVCRHGKRDALKRITLFFIVSLIDFNLDFR